MISLDDLNRTVLLCRDYVASFLSDDEICESLQSLKVAIVSDLHNLSSHSGQTALVTLVSLLNRTGFQVRLTIPEVSMLWPQPPISGCSVGDALASSSGDLVSCATVRLGLDSEPDIVFVLGDTRATNFKAPTWRLNGDEWYGTVSAKTVSGLNPWTAEWPVGAMISAALAANEAFKFVMRRLPFREDADRIFFEPSQFCSWDFGSVPLPGNTIDLGHTDLISAGAIAQAALYALVRLPRIQMCGRIFDDDLTERSNLNRNMLTLAADVGSPKVAVASQQCAAKILLEPLPHRFSPDNSGAINLSHRVLVGVDDIPSRWEIQRHSPGWVAVSGTSHFNISSSDHRVEEPCCGCLHPVDDVAGLDRIPTISFVSFWAGLAMAVRLVREALGHPYPRNKQHLWLSPLRMDLQHGAMWFPVPPLRGCPVKCLASRSVL